MYMNLKSYDKKIIFIPNIFLITLKVNKCQRVYLSKKEEKKSQILTYHKKAQVCGSILFDFKIIPAAAGPVNV